MGINFEVIRILRLHKKTATVYLLVCQDRPLRVVNVARLLEIDRSTARGYLYSLVSIGLIARPDLLVTILESSVPALPLNAKRHLSDCDCQYCRMLAYRTRPYCGENPCECGA